MACRTFWLSPSCYRYSGKYSFGNTKIADLLDDFNREGLGIEVDFSLPTERLIRSLNYIIEWCGAPQGIGMDNGPEYISRKWVAWATKRNIDLGYIQPGKPQQNAYVERYHRTVRHELLNQHIIKSIEEAQEHATKWLWTYHKERSTYGHRWHNTSHET